MRNLPVLYLLKHQSLHLDIEKGTSALPLCLNKTENEAHFLMPLKSMEFPSHFEVIENQNILTDILESNYKHH